MMENLFMVFIIIFGFELMVSATITLLNFRSYKDSVKLNEREKIWKETHDATMEILKARLDLVKEEKRVIERTNEVMLEEIRKSTRRVAKQAEKDSQSFQQMLERSGRTSKGPA